MPGMKPGGRFGKYLPPVMTAAGVLVVWEAVVRAAGVPRYIFPAPSVIAAEIAATRGQLWAAGFYTLGEAVAGFAVGGAIAVGVAIVFVSWRAAEEGLMPLAISLNAVPMIALAPIAVNWFGFGPASKLSLVAVAVFFPIFISAFKGFLSCERGSLLLMRSYASPPWQVMRKVRFPTALPLLFSGLRTAAPLSLIVAVVAEFFGSQKGIGLVIETKSTLADAVGLWAAVITTSLLGLMFFGAVILAERIVIPWHASRRRKTAP